MVLKQSPGEPSEKPALGTSLMELILESRNVNNAWKQVKSNGGSPGIDGINVERFPDYFRPRWPKIKQALLQGYYIPKPVKRVALGEGQTPQDLGPRRLDRGGASVGAGIGWVWRPLFW